MISTRKLKQKLRATIQFSILYIKFKHKQSSILLLFLFPLGNIPQFFFKITALLSTFFVFSQGLCKNTSTNAIHRIQHKIRGH